MEQLKTKELHGLAQGLELLSLQAAVAPRNRVFANGIVGVGQTAPAAVVVVAGVVRPRISGVFRVDISSSFQGTGDYFYDLQVFTSAVAFPANLGPNGLETSAGSNVFYLNADAAGNPANGLTFGGAVGTSLFGATMTCTAAESLSIHNGTLYDVGSFPFTNQQYVAFGIAVTSAGNTALPQFSVSVWEQA